MTTVVECYQLAKAKGYPAFGLQIPNICWSSSDALQTYGKYGANGTNCAGTNGLGGGWANDVYMILGTFHQNSGGRSSVSFFSYQLNLSLQFLLFSSESFILPYSSSALLPSRFLSLSQFSRPLSSVILAFSTLDLDDLPEEKRRLLAVWKLITKLRAHPSVLTHANSE